GALCRPPPPLAGDQLVALPLVGGSHEHRLQDAELSYRSRERCQRLFFELHARLMAVRLDVDEREVHEGRPAVAGNVGRYQRSETSTQPAAARHHSPPWPAPDRRSRLGRWDRTRRSAARMTALPTVAQCGGRYCGTPCRRSAPV